MRASSNFTVRLGPASFKGGWAMSRRGLLAGLAAAPLLPALAAAQDTTPAPNPAQTPTPPTGQNPAAPSTADTADIAARTDADEHLSIDVMVNGTGPYHFVVDTGAERTVLADTIANGLGLIRGETVLVDGLALKIPATTVTIDKLAFGPFTRKALILPVLSRTLLGCDGYLGLDAISHACVTFDFAHHLLRIDQSSGMFAEYDPLHQSSRVQLAGNDGRLRTADCWVDGVVTTAFIDTGAEISIGNLALHAALNQRKQPPTDLGRIELVGITGGQAIGTMIPIRHIKLQEINFTNGTLAIADVPNFENWGLATRPALLIGMDFLRQFGSVAIDYRAREIRFDLAGALEDGPPNASIAHV